MDDLNALSDSEIQSKLNNIPGWEYHDNKIHKQYEFKSFNEALEFINKLAPVFNELDHHPDMHIYYKKVIFELTRFSIGGKVTERDFTIAKKIEREYQSL